MSAGWVGLLGLCALISVIALQVPIGFALLIVGVIGYAMQIGLAPALTILAAEPASILSSVDVAVAPLFLLMGVYATKAGFSADLFRAVAALFGHRRGGLAYATVGGSALFGVVCGSSIATAATFGKAALPEMLKRGYSPSYATGTVAAGGTLKALIPPSLPMIFYCIVSKTFIFDLFTAAIIPALLSVALNAAAVAVTVRLIPGLAPVSEPLPWRERWDAVRRASPLLILVLGIFGGFYSGAFTVNEAAAVAAIATLVFALAMRRLTWRQVLDGLRETAGTTAMLYILLIGAFVFSHFLGLARVPEAMIEAVGSLDMPPLAIIGMMLFSYILLGTVFDEVTAMLITLPFALPIVVSLGYHPVWWGIINVVIIELGMILPPVGIIVILLHSLAPQVSIRRITLGVTPYIVANFLLLAILTLFPVLSLVLLGSG